MDYNNGLQQWITTMYDNNGLQQSSFYHDFMSFEPSNVLSFKTFWLDIKRVNDNDHWTNQYCKCIVNFITAEFCIIIKQVTA